MSKTVKEIVEEWLSANGYDGLRSDGGDCGCLTEDLMPCDCDVIDCGAAYRVPCDRKNCEYDSCDFHMVTEKPKS